MSKAESILRLIREGTEVEAEKRRQQSLQNSEPQVVKDRRQLQKSGIIQIFTQLSRDPIFKDAKVTVDRENKFENLAAVHLRFDPHTVTYTLGGGGGCDGPGWSETYEKTEYCHIRAKVEYGRLSINYSRDEDVDRESHHPFGLDSPPHKIDIDDLSQVDQTIADAVLRLKRVKSWYV